jgi:hypothetical protein
MYQLAATATKCVWSVTALLLSFPPTRHVEETRLCLSVYYVDIIHLGIYKH